MPRAISHLGDFPFSKFHPSGTDIASTVLPDRVGNPRIKTYLIQRLLPDEERSMITRISAKKHRTPTASRNGHEAAEKTRERTVSNDGQT